METVKSLQMEPRLEARYDEMLAQYLAAVVSPRASQLFQHLQRHRQRARADHDACDLCVGALLVMKNEGFTIGMLVAFQMFAGRMSQPMLRLAGLWQEFQQTSIAVKRLGDNHGRPPPNPTRSPFARRRRPRARSGSPSSPSDNSPTTRSSSGKPQPCLTPGKPQRPYRPIGLR